MSDFDDPQGTQGPQAPPAPGPEGAPETQDLQGPLAPARAERRRPPRTVARVPCGLCGKEVTRSSAIRAEAVRPEVADFIVLNRGSEWASGYVCPRCLDSQRAGYIINRLHEERGALSVVEAEVARKAGAHATVVEDIDREFNESITFGQRMADTVARVGGSWAFLIGFALFLAGWMIVNAFVLRARPFDPFPFILLNLMLSTLAACQAPIIMMSQNRLAARDRMQADQDFRVNLKAEIEIATLHEKVDHLLHAQWQRMVEMQQVQIELLHELSGRRKASPRPDGA